MSNVIEIGNFRCELLKHSIGHHGLEAITYLETHERKDHADIMTHRWSRNHSSSRAMPYDKMIDWISRDPAMPLHLGSNRSGMQSGPEVEDSEELRRIIKARYKNTVLWCDTLADQFNPHKEILNRYTEPWGWITGIHTMGRAQLMNAFNLRINKKAGPNVQRLFVAMARLYRDSKPRRLEPGQWHIPFVDSIHSRTTPGTAVPLNHDNLIWSAARSAWCSYNNPTKDATFEKAKKRHDDCITYKHATPLEHQLRCREDRGQRGCVPGYDSYRMMIPGESAAEFDFSILDTEYKDRWYVPDL